MGFLLFCECVGVKFEIEVPCRQLLLSEKYFKFELKFGFQFDKGCPGFSLQRAFQPAPVRIPRAWDI